MSLEIRLPSLSPSMIEADLVKWHVQVGDFIRVGDLIAEVETDKASAEIEAPVEGTIQELLFEAGATEIAVDSLLARVAAGQSVADTEPADTGMVAPPVAAPPVVAPSASGSPSKRHPTVDETARATDSNGDGIGATPLARRMAQQAGLSLADLPGSLPGERIGKADVEAALGFPHSKTTGQEPPECDKKTSEKRVPEAEPPFELRPLDRVRRLTAQRLTLSKQQAPHFYITQDCDVSELAAFRDRHNASAVAETRISWNDLLIKFTAMALQKSPAANSAWSEDGVKQFKSIDISLAVSIAGGLITPVLRQADRKSLSEIASEARDLAELARSGRLRPDQCQGGTFTISNLGMHGVRQFAAIVNPPQACILAVGAAEPRPVVRTGQVEIATVITCTLSADHRVLDGAEAAEFLGTLKGYLEDPLSVLID